MIMQLFEPSEFATWLWAGLYICSGICQPLLMTQAKLAGLADSSAQLYMFFYYLGPSLLVFTLIFRPSSSSSWPTRNLIGKATVIASFDILAQGLNYTGAALAGPTIFSIIYSSVTVWTAVFSRLFLKRSLSTLQWIAIVIVFCGLAVTAMDSTTLGPELMAGTLLIFVGSIMHGATYVMSEAIMTTGRSTTASSSQEQLTVRQNVAIQGSVACLALGGWQVVYTLPRFQQLIRDPMTKANTHWQLAVAIMAGFGLANLVHSLTFSHTLKYFRGGATSAGVMKGLQAVLVFVASHLVYCGRVGGSEMCFTKVKFISLVSSLGLVCF
jgi:drug/metabolite transporter (DMT)-like permease